MSDLKKNPKAQPGAKGKGTPDEPESMRQMDRDADEMADKGLEEEERYDEDHGAFDKL